MNIFYLSSLPKIAASFHCDQHLHKMILESAQMLSTLAWKLSPSEAKAALLYRPTHPNHPCIDYLTNNQSAQDYLLSLCFALDDIRKEQGSSEHSSINILRKAYHILSDDNVQFSQKSPIFCGPAHIRLDSRHHLVSDKYQEYYRFKAKQWALDGKVRMSYKGRSVPSFLSSVMEYIQT
jgi:hypothetical protein